MVFQDYSYAVSRIKVIETKLLTKKDFHRLILQQDYGSAVKVLAELGYNCRNSMKFNEILKAEQAELWRLMSELVQDTRALDIFRIQNDYHNLKVSVKAVYSNISAEPMLVTGGTIDGLFVYESVKNREYKNLPSALAEVASESLELLLKTGSAQLCDVVIDKASLDALAEHSRMSHEESVKEYSELCIAGADIKVALRGASCNKNIEYFSKALAKCKSLNKKILAESAVKGVEDVCDYLSATEYKDEVQYIKKSVATFENRFNSLILKRMEKYKHQPFDIGPLVYYILTKQNELSNVRLILVAKLTAEENSVINERIREMYV